jgi:hypothetical protein
MSIKQNGGVFGRNPTFNDVTIEGDLIINGEVFSGLDFQGSWNASTNSPALASGVGTKGEFYIVSVAGTTSLDGISNWGIGDWALFNGTVWQRVEGGADGNFDDLTSNSLTVNGPAVFNEGSIDADFRVESNNLQNALFVQGSNGYTGVGNTPVSPLDVSAAVFGLPASSGSTAAGIMRVGYADRSWDGNEMLFGIINASSSGQDYGAYIQCKNPTNYAINRTFLLNPIGGTVRIGANTSAWTTNSGVRFNNLASADQYTTFTNTSTSASDRVMYLACGNVSGKEMINFYNNGASVGTITTTGSATSYNISSDYRLKENVVPITDSIERVKALRPSRFNFIVDPDQTVDGFLAHEAASVVAECASGTKDAMKDEEYEITAAIDQVIDEDGNVTTEATEAVMGTRSVPDYQGIDQSKLVPLLTAALQEAIIKIEELTTRIENLEGQ